VNAIPPLLETRAPAKVNLCLYVGPHRPDGRHEICSIFQPVTLADRLVMQTGHGGQDEVECPGLAGPNLAAAALAAFRERFGWDGPPVRITIEKLIPVAAGLGGGSADAGAALRLATAASGIRPPHGELADLALALGADVPSQIEPATALVGGAGERIEPVAGGMKLAALLLAELGALDTGSVYARADELGAAREDLQDLEARVRQALAGAGGDVLALAPVLHNDLQAAAVGLEPAAADALRMLREEGAFAQLVSGSGPSVFGLFRNDDEAELARAALSQRWAGSALVVKAAPSGYADVRPSA
jgi:4-diphosphocytidyl-2-C-methyl-D-erythritol kinase